MLFEVKSDEKIDIIARGFGTRGRFDAKKRQKLSRGTGRNAGMP